MSTNRRGFFSWLAGTLAALVSGPHVMRYNAVWAETRIVPVPEILFADVKKTPWLLGKIVVYCNGKEVAHCYTANVIEGWCVVAVIDKRGAIQLNSSMTEILRKRIYGTVRIERKVDAHRA